MNKLRLMLLAGAAALALATSAPAAERARSPDPVQNPAPEQSQPRADPNGAVVDDAQAGAAVSAREQEYLSGLKKCESLDGQQREQCVEAARKKAGQM
jgi:hypothetical protein